MLESLTMSIADRVREMTETLPIEKQAEVLDFVEFIRTRSMKSAADAVQRDAEEKARLRMERFGVLRDAFTIAPDFDAPLPEDIIRDFEGG
jgi:Protein of unknown function (DUF2281)